MRREEQVRLLKELMRHRDEGTNVDAGGHRRNPTDVYRSPEIAAQEWEHFFQGHPQLLGLSGDLPKPGSFVTSRDFGGPVLATRDAEGRFRAFANTCRHRGVVLEDRERGEAERFVCPFHAWTYSNAGELVAIPKPDHFGTIDKTCREAGEIELVFRPKRKNDVRLLLLMDVGGTMDPYFEPVSRLLTALHEERGLRDFQAYYFHNCIYERVYTSGRLLRNESIMTADLLRTYGERWKLMVVGDAAMHPSELNSARGNINFRNETETSGASWLDRLERHFDRSVWLNPDRPVEWAMSSTCRQISTLFPMFHLSVNGLEEGVKGLVGARPAVKRPILAPGTARL